MIKNANTAKKTAFGMAIGALSGTMVCGILAAVAWASGNDSFAKGILWGGALGIAGMMTLLILSRTRHATAEARLAAGAGDERERAAAVRSGATAFVCMYLATIVCAFGNSFGMDPAAGYAITMFTGLIAALTSFAIRVRRG